MIIDDLTFVEVIHTKNAILLEEHPWSVIQSWVVIDKRTALFDMDAYKAGRLKNDSFGFCAFSYCIMKNAMRKFFIIDNDLEGTELQKLFNIKQKKQRHKIRISSPQS